MRQDRRQQVVATDKENSKNHSTKTKENVEKEIEVILEIGRHAPEEN